MDKPQSAPLFGVLLVLAAVAFLSVMDATIKVVLDGGIAVLQMLALRSWLVVPVLAIWALRKGGWAAVRTGRVKLHLLRVVMGTGAPVFFFTSLKTLPLADATTIFFGASFLMTGLSVVVLNERVGPHRWAAVVVGFIGVMVAMQPDGEISAGALYALASSLSYAAFILITRKLGSSEGAVKQVLYFHAWLGTLGTASLPFVYQPFAGQDIALIALAGALVVGGHLCLTRGFSIAPVGLLAPFEYTAMIWAALLGFAIWGEVPGPQVMLGAGIIVASGLYLTYRETRSVQRERKLEREFEDDAELAAAAAGPIALVTPRAAKDAVNAMDDKNK